MVLSGGTSLRKIALGHRGVDKGASGWSVGEGYAANALVRSPGWHSATRVRGFQEILNFLGNRRSGWLTRRRAPRTVVFDTERHANPQRSPA